MHLFLSSLFPSRAAPVKGLPFLSRAVRPNVVEMVAAGPLVVVLPAVSAAPAGAAVPVSVALAVGLAVALVASSADPLPSKCG